MIVTFVPHASRRLRRRRRLPVSAHLAKQVFRMAPGYVGQAGDLNSLITFMNQTWGNWQNEMQTHGTTLWPPLPEASDVAKVLYSWWPYLKQQFPNQWPSSPADPAVVAGHPANIGNPLLFLQMVTQAAKLLHKVRLPGNVFLGVPWDRINLNEFPWAVVNTWAEYTGMTLDQVWSFIKQATSPLMTLASGPSYGVVTGPSGQLGQIDFGAVDFANDDLRFVPWDGLSDPSAQFLAMLNDPRVIACMADPSFASESKYRFKEMLGCKQCYLGKGSDAFFQGVCGTEDPCACTKTVEMPLPKEPPPVVVPGAPPPAGPGTETVAVHQEKKDDKSVLYVLGIGAVAAIAGWYLLK